MNYTRTKPELSILPVGFRVDPKEGHLPSALSVSLCAAPPFAALPCLFGPAFHDVHTASPVAA